MLTESEDQRRLRDIERVAEHFFFWQGLRWVPLGLALVAAVFTPDEVFRSEALHLTFLCSVIAAGWIVSGVFGRYYNRNYGRVRPIPGRHERREHWKWSFVYPAMVLSLVIDVLWAGPFFVSGPVWAAGVLLYRQCTGGGRLHYVAFALVLSAMGFLPLAGVVGPGRGLFVLFFAVIGVSYVIGGLLDHFEMTRILGPPTRDGDDAPV